MPNASERGIALVTGGGRGIGAACALALAQCGFDVAVASVENEADAADTMARLRATGVRSAYFQCDIAALDRHDALLQGIDQALGTVDCLVNNAGVSSLVRGDLLDLSVASFDRSVAVNLRGTFFLTQAVARRMVANRESRPDRYRSIVTITSANAEIVGENRGDYCMSKAALSMMSRLYAARLAGNGVHVFELRPGIIRTDMTRPAAAKYDQLIARAGVPIARWGEPEDVGATVATIACGGLPFATGEVINVGGGLHLHRV